MRLRIINTEDGFRVWQNNKLIALTDSRKLYPVANGKRGESLGEADTESEIRTLLVLNDIA